MSNIKILEQMKPLLNDEEFKAFEKAVHRENRELELFRVPYDTLSNAFLWADTPEGHSYWEKISTRILNEVRPLLEVDRVVEELEGMTEKHRQMVFDHFNKGS